MGAPSEPLTSEIRAERERLCALLTDLSPEQWEVSSLCAGWRVREVVAHVTMPFRTTSLGFLAGMARAGFSFNRYADRDARATARMLSGNDLVDLLRRNTDHPWQPPRGGQVGALSHDVIHGLDVTEPLGLPAAPPERIATVLASTSPRQVRYFGVDLTGRRLTASDADVTVGEGAQVHTMPAKDVLLVLTGRRCYPRTTR
jgi:uncharacterized protein (TIGR03083 family)